MTLTRQPGQEVTSSDDVVAACPYVVRRGRAIIAAFSTRPLAINWLRDYSNFTDSNATFIVHTATEIVAAYRDGIEVDIP